MQFIIKRNVKDFFKKNKMRVGEKVYGSLDQEVEGLLLKAMGRAKMNRRSTILEGDF